MKNESKNIIIITDSFIENICALLKNGKAVNKLLPGNGRIHIDRKLPFISIYRKPLTYTDEGTQSLIYGTSSYINGGSISDEEFSKLLKAIAGTLSNFFHSFLILEIWEEDENNLRSANVLNSLKPNFRILSNEREGSDIFSTIQILKKSLLSISIHKQHSDVEFLFSKNINPPGRDPLIGLRELKKMNCYMAGLEVRPVYKNILTNKFYPQVLVILSGQMVHVLNSAFFEFSKKLTTHEAKHFYALGKSSFVKQVGNSDKKLAALCDLYDFIIQVSPINEAEARADFQRSKNKKIPVFYYRPLSFNPSEFKKALWNIPINEIEDPAIKNLFSGKRDEVDLQISMMINIDNPGFHYGSLQLYGNVNKSLSKIADEILTIFGRKHHTGKSKIINAAEFYKYVIKEFDYYRSIYPLFKPHAEINKDMFSGLIVSKNKLLIGKEFTVPEPRMEALIQHEVGTHLLTYFNGLAQPFKQLHTGLSGYEELQEGLAVLSEYLSGGLNIFRLRLLAARVKAAEYMIDGADFVESFHNLVRNYGFTEFVAFTISMRIYRGGGLTKDIIYLRGFMEILKYIEKGEDIEPLFAGKISLSQVSIMKELELRGILKPVPLLPRYLKNEEAVNRLKALQTGYSIINYFKHIKQNQ
ncbi:MAG: flavohemoglobin expression-modulating QEGLA motif protein [Bacteroidota bacterium]|nr:flavohemoglobin expression-modulating QEGLA motif protein [Bacteroidota bacterium]